MLKQKQADSRELQELKYKVEKEYKYGSKMAEENEELRKRLAEIQDRYMQLEAQKEQMQNDFEKKLDDQFNQFT